MATLLDPTRFVYGNEGVTRDHPATGVAMEHDALHVWDVVIAESGQFPPWGVDIQSSRLLGPSGTATDA